jgi:hypothetical protein
VDKDLTNYLSCQIVFSEEKQAWIGQPYLIKNLQNKFLNNKVKQTQVYRTPGTPGVGILRPKEGSKKVRAEEQSDYRPGVGMLLFLVKHSRLDIANPVRKLSKCMDGASRAAMKELLRVNHPGY